MLFVYFKSLAISTIAHYRKNLTEFRTFYQNSTNFCPLKYENISASSCSLISTLFVTLKNYVHARTVERKPLINTVFQS
jgi:hypothetical protein